MACGNVRRRAADTYAMGTQGTRRALGLLPAAHACVDYFPRALPIWANPSLPTRAI